MNRLILSLVLCAAQAVAAVVVCQDGRKVARNPFNQSQTDAQLCGEAPRPKPPEITVPAFYVEVFGPRPEAKDFKDYRDFQAARDKWDQDLRHFKGFGLPAWMKPENLADSNEYFAAWGFGPAVIYEGRFGFAAFVKAERIGGFEMPAFTIVYSPQNVVTEYQKLVGLSGHCIPKAARHPWTPESVFAGCKE